VPSATGDVAIGAAIGRMADRLEASVAIRRVADEDDIDVGFVGRP